MPNLRSLIGIANSKHFNRVAKIRTRSVVTALVLSDDSRFLGIGTRDGLAIHDNMYQLARTPEYHRMCGHVSQIHWIAGSGDEVGIAFGTVFGYFIIWLLDTKNKFRQSASTRLPTSSEVMAIDSSRTSASVIRFVVGLADNGLIIVDYEDTRPLHVVDKLSLKNTIPRGIRFNAEGTRVLVAGLDDGELLDVEIAARTVEITHSLSPKMLSVSWAPTLTDTFIIVDNGADGFSLFRCSVGETSHTFETPCATKSIPNGVAFFQQGNFFLAGSDGGEGYIFDVAKRSIHDVLYHTRKGHIQHVTAGNTGTGQILACALSTNDSVSLCRRKKAASEVSIWHAKPPIQNIVRRRPRSTIGEYFMRALHMLGYMYGLYRIVDHVGHINYETNIKAPYMRIWTRILEASTLVHTQTQAAPQTSDASPMSDVFQTLVVSSTLLNSETHSAPFQPLSLASTTSSSTLTVIAMPSLPHMGETITKTVYIQFTPIEQTSVAQPVSVVKDLSTVNLAQSAVTRTSEAGSQRKESF